MSIDDLVVAGGGNAGMTGAIEVQDAVELEAPGSPSASAYAAVRSVTVVMVAAPFGFSFPRPTSRRTRSSRRRWQEAHMTAPTAP